MRVTRTLGTILVILAVSVSELSAKQLEESSSSSVGDNPGALSSSSKADTSGIQKPKEKSEELAAAKNKTGEPEVKKAVEDEEKVKEGEGENKNKTISLSDTAEGSSKDKPKKKGEEKKPLKDKSSDISDPENANNSSEPITNAEENVKDEDSADSGDDPDVAPLKEKTETENNVKNNDKTKPETNNPVEEPNNEDITDITKTPIVDTPVITTTKAPPAAEKETLIKEIYNEESVTPGVGGEGTQSNFLGYLIVLSILTIVAYLVFHNKKKILGLIVEGRSSRQPGRRRSNGREYRKLDSNVEDMMETGKETSMRQVIY